ncbi:aggregation-promoting factor C-terminal-like domain-containing protein [Bifidobacterium xylocopae]|uniref:Bacteriophage lysin domain-containing protein n=1 Tax=Bifidobacterium xylocopae TaxID=2493119 RepID=A0A366KBU7_9BIFI|nr:peptidoglycan amidohydrolase family protein [Bifidobacterium xylocopae]RBP98837.1 hypothetical protein CRD59_07025 [Bifidobacterium xylocopae]
MTGGSKSTPYLVAGSISLIVCLFGSLLIGTLFASACGTGPTGTGAQGGASADNANYRPPEHSDDPVAEGISTFVERISLDDSHGYSQSRRQGNPDYDCSSLVWFAAKSAGFDGQMQGWPFTTFTMGPVLERLGFAHLTWSGDYRNAKSELKRGDVVVNPAEHTEVYLGGGLFGGAHHAYPSGIDDGMPGDQGHGDDQEIGIEAYLTPGLNQVYRHDPSAKATGGSGASTDGADAPTACTPQDSGPAGDNPDGTNASPDQAKQIARRMVGEYFPGEDPGHQYGCLEPMWTHESGWRWNAQNASSGAYGIPQSLPGNKMAAAGDDWQTNATTQIKWGLQYIKTRYHTPCEAWDIWQRKGWY